MAYDLKLAERIRAQLEGIPFVEKNMFGGVGFLIGGNTPARAPGASVACGVNKDDLIVRIDPEKQSTLLKKPHAKPFDLTGKPMKGWLVVGADGVKRKSNSVHGSRKGLSLHRRYHQNESNGLTGDHISPAKQDSSLIYGRAGAEARSR